LQLLDEAERQREKRIKKEYYEFLEKKRKKKMQSGFHIGYPKCFWTDTYYSSYDEMQKLYKDNGVECVDHFAQDGLAPLFHNRVDQWSDEQFETWFKYHLSVCSEKSIINMSNHVIIVGRKK